MNFSIKDKLNYFGQTDTPGELPDTIYVGRGDKSLAEKDFKGDAAQSQGEGGEISQPYYVEFTASVDPEVETTLEALGAPEEDGAAGDYNVVGSLVIPAGQPAPGNTYRVAVSGNGCKYFKARFQAEYEGEAHPEFSAFLMRYKRMNMNREAVDAALALAGNLPLTDDDKKFRNLVYVVCKNQYLPTLFNSLTEIDWRCARKYARLRETRRHTLREPDKYYYEMPADCVRPLRVDGNEGNFRNDTDFIITDYPAETLYYVFHKRRLRRGEAVELATELGDYDREPYLETSPDAEDGYDPAFALRVSPDAVAEPEPGEEEDFPDWEYTPYDADFWQYFSYKLAARIVPRLRMDDGAGQRAQALDALAKQKGEEAVERSRAAASNPAQPVKLWIERAGIGRRERSGGYEAPLKTGKALRYF